MRDSFYNREGEQGEKHQGKDSRSNQRRRKGKSKGKKEKPKA